MNNKELDLSSYTELNADGKVLWNQTLSNIVNPDKLYDYFNFKVLGEDFKTDYANIVDFDLSLDSDKKDEMDNNYFTYNSEQSYIAVKLKLSKKGSTDSNYKIKNVDLKIKVGGLNEQVIWDLKQEKVKQMFNEYVNDKQISFNSDEIKDFLETYSSSDWNWSNLLLYMRNNFFTFLNLSKHDISKEEITNYVDIDFLSIFDDEKKENLNLNNAIYEAINTSKNNVVKIKIIPKQKHDLTNGNEWNVSYYQDFSSFSFNYTYRNYLQDLFTKNQSFFDKEVIVFNKNSSDLPLKIAELRKILIKKLSSFFENNLDYKDFLKYFRAWPEFIFDHEKHPIDDESILEQGTYYFSISWRVRKYTSGWSTTKTIVKINVEVK